MYTIKQSTTMLYNPYSYFQCDKFNCSLLDLLKTVPKEQKTNLPLYVPLLMFAYNAIPHSITGFQSYDLMFGLQSTHCI